MKMKFAAVASICVLAVLCSSASVIFASDSDADAAVYDGYYKNQLTAEQKTIYDAIAALAPSAAIGGNETDGYYLTVTGTGLSTDVNDIERAWFATKLEASEASNWAFWAWNTAGVKATFSEISASGFRIGIDAAFKDGFADKVTAVTNAVNAAAEKITGDTDSKKVKSINSILTGKGYGYVDTNEAHVFANTVYAFAAPESDTCYMTSFAYSAVFKALCTKAGVASIQVYGFFGDQSKIFAWNEVLVEDKVYGVDCATNATSKNKEQWLCAGAYTAVDGNAYSKVHIAFPYSVASGLTSQFSVDRINNEGYSWPADNSLIAKITEYAPWILVGIICIVMAVALVYMAKRGD